LNTPEEHEITEFVTVIIKWQDTDANGYDLLTCAHSKHMIVLRAIA
jgi:hypothetical protein